MGDVSLCRLGVGQGERTVPGAVSGLVLSLLILEIGVGSVTELFLYTPVVKQTTALTCGCSEQSP